MHTMKPIRHHGENFTHVLGALSEILKKKEISRVNDSARKKFCVISKRRTQGLGEVSEESRI